MLALVFKTPYKKKKKYFEGTCTAVFKSAREA